MKPTRDNKEYVSIFGQAVELIRNTVKELKPIKAVQLDIEYDAINEHQKLNQYRKYNTSLLIACEALGKELYEARYGKNVIRRNEGLEKAINVFLKLDDEHDLKSFLDIERAKWKNEDIDRVPHKHHKLKIVGGRYSEMAQHIVDEDIC